MSSAQCYYKLDSKVSAWDGYFPCGNSTNGEAVACCGPGHWCMSSGFCYYPVLVPGGWNYYTQGCTDATWKSGACPNSCTDQDLSDCIYHTDTANWQCCGRTNGTLQCATPAGSYFDAPAPAHVYKIGAIDKQGVYSAVPADVVSAASMSAARATATGMATGTGTGVSMGTATSTPAGTADAQAGASGLSGGAIGGIAAAAGVAVLLLLISLFFFVRLRTARRRLARSEAALGRTYPMSYDQAAKQGVVRPPELDPTSKNIVEIGESNEGRAELYGGQDWDRSGDGTGMRV